VDQLQGLVALVAARGVLEGAELPGDGLALPALAAADLGDGGGGGRGGVGRRRALLGTRGALFAGRRSSCSSCPSGSEELRGGGAGDGAEGVGRGGGGDRVRSVLRFEVLRFSFKSRSRG